MTVPFECRLPGALVSDLRFHVPLDHSKPSGRSISIFVRQVVSSRHVNNRQMPYLLYLQGGPGIPSPRPTGAAGWMKRALQEYRLLLLDQRGTGLSAPINQQTLKQFKGDEDAIASHLSLFRADSIVRDAELIRKELLGENGKWAVLGQSFGGFVLTHYLSVAPEGLSAAFFCGGLPPLGRNAEEVYTALAARVVDRNRRYYERYPMDKERVRTVVQYLRANKVMLPFGGQLTARRFQQLGICFGMNGGFERLHYLVEGAFVDIGGVKELSFEFLRGVQAAEAFDCYPLYAALHESIYCEGTASRWAAHRVRQRLSEFDDARAEAAAATKAKDTVTPGGADAEEESLADAVFFTGEMVFPWMFDDYSELAGLKKAAEKLATREDWPVLYDIDSLRSNLVPCAAVVYYDDMYVERKFSEETAKTIQGTKVWVTNEYDHDGLVAAGASV
eukprot:CAMPEP_0114615332 /NCGR_PEP_ID=MMETSP0168-20121206/6111_1 /TAXON_ID=95228 ORGANISM="Vannella sp., Strain DIVA3 517/6/12" /NCGR_SAMPLE_ID=MMETSP0168 /ASSEMBLY_ACC=CAM_ASM_000044 /LENGTH=446 /DNA_ID=CAMNT_0001826401 /DNA_START=76 /DNA_END=1413 /DNA_ORIENTATION=+